MTDMKTSNGLKVVMNRAFKYNPSYKEPSKFKIGRANGTPIISDTDIDMAIPLLDGTVNDDGSNTLTGSSGGDNSTANTTTFKAGAGETDVTAQNLIGNATNATKIWTIADLSSAGNVMTADQPFGLWLKILDAAALAKFLSAGTCLEIKLGSDSSNYYSIEFEASDLATGWNWITSNAVNVEDMTETSTVVGAIDTFIIEVTTNNSTDAFIAGDLIFDLLRQWEYSDIIQDFVTAYPSFNETTMKVTIRGFVTSTQMNGFDFNVAALENEDTSIKVTDIDDFDNDSKADTDEFAFEFVTQFVQG